MKHVMTTVLFDLFTFASYTLVKIFNAMKQFDLALGFVWIKSRVVAYEQYTNGSGNAFECSHTVMLH